MNIPGRSRRAPRRKARFRSISAQIEAEIAVLSRAEREEYLGAIGLKEPGLDRLIRAGYALLHLVTYFTIGPGEARAWTITKGTRAPQAAGVIHRISRKASSAPRPSPTTTMSHIRAKPARDVGKLRLEGKEYVVADGDVLHPASRRERRAGQKDDAVAGASSGAPDGFERWLAQHPIFARYFGWRLVALISAILGLIAVELYSRRIGGRLGGYFLLAWFISVGILLGFLRQYLHKPRPSWMDLDFPGRVGRLATTLIGTALFLAPVLWLGWLVASR